MSSSSDSSVAGFRWNEGPRLAAARLLRRMFHESCRLFMYWMFIVVGRVRVMYVGRPPQKGGFILASNHISHFEPAVISAFFLRKLDWMAMKEIFRHPVAGRVLDWLGAFPVHRDGSDRTALRTAVKRLELGHIVGIFPEGGIRAGRGSVLEGAAMYPGVGALAALSQKPVLPCVVLGTDRLYHVRNWLPFRRVPIWMAFGELIEPPAGMSRAEAREHVNARLSEAFVSLKELLRERYRLADSDLPQTPQARKGEPPLPRHARARGACRPADPSRAGGERNA